MGGSHSSSVSICSQGSRSRSSTCSKAGRWCLFFQAKYDVEESSRREPLYVSRKIRPSDEDRGWWVGESDVDMKASAFIARFHQNRFLELESHDARLLQDVDRLEQSQTPAA